MADELAATTYFVTGATGFIGRALCRELRRTGRRVRALVRRGVDAELEGLGVEFVAGDLGDSASYADALRGVEVVMHLGGDANFGNGRHYHHVNNVATRELLDATQRMSPRLRRFVFVSTMGAVDRARSDGCDRPLTEDSPAAPTTDYGRSKLAAEAAVRESSLPWTIVRPALVVGPGMRPQSHVAQFVRMALRGTLLSRFNLPGGMSIIHVDDLTRSLVRLANHGEAAGRDFFAAGERATLGDVFLWAAPERGKIGCGLARLLARPVRRFLPFKAKALLFDALTADDSALTSLVGPHQHSARETVEEIANQERRRQSIAIPVAGATLVTRAGSGLGAALAARLARMGRRLILVDKNSTALASVVPDAVDVRRIVCDLSREGEVDNLLAQDFWTHDRVDEVLACAGFGARGEAADLPGKLQANIFHVNVIARVRLCQHAAALMRARRFGRVVLISSSSAFQPLPYMAAYAASNAALLSFGEAFWAEMRDAGVKVLTVCPGGMATNFQRAAGVKVLPNERLDSPDSVAERIIRALDADRCTLLIGARAKGMSAVARLMPRGANVRLWRRLMHNLR